jgi:hypothetical protein
MPRLQDVRVSGGPRRQPAPKGIVVRNHHDKVTDISPSALPSVHRRSARRQRAAVHRSERRQLGEPLRELELITDPDEHAGDLRWIDRQGLDDLVGERRSSDKLGPLLHWAERTIATSLNLRDSTPAEQARHFELRLPDTVAGRHAAAHIRGLLDPPYWLLALGRGRASY